MSIRTTKAYLDEHARLRDGVEHFLVAARELPEQGINERIDVTERIAAFLAEMLLPHYAAEQSLLYPGAARLLGEPDASDSVAADRVAVRDLLGRLAVASPKEPGEIQEILYALYALLSSHFWREEEVYLRLAAHRSEGTVAEMLDEVSQSGRRVGRFARPSPTARAMV